MQLYTKYKHATSSFPFYTSKRVFLDAGKLMFGGSLYLFIIKFMTYPFCLVLILHSEIIRAAHFVLFFNKLLFVYLFSAHNCIKAQNSKEDSAGRFFHPHLMFVRPQEKVRWFVQFDKIKHSYNNKLFVFRLHIWYWTW